MKSVSHKTTEPLRETTPDLDVRLGNYVVRFARNAHDLDQVFKLRFEVFNLELGGGLEESFETRRDTDAFDEQCDHLMVVDYRTKEVVGTYRLQTSESAMHGKGFYSGTEFGLDAIPDEIVANSVELGRACVGKEHRSTRVLFLLWRGLIAYMTHNQKRFFFGCCSLTSQNGSEGLKAYQQLEARELVRPDFTVYPQPGYECDGSAEEVEPVKIPTLFELYLRYGAKVCGPPAIDRFFGTIDFLALLDMEDLGPRTLKQFSF